MQEIAQNFMKKIKKIFRPVNGVFVIKVFLLLAVVLAIFLLLKPQKVTELMKTGEDELESYKSSEEVMIVRDIFEVGSSDPDSDATIDTIQLSEESSVYGLTIDADINLPQPDSFVRVVLFDDESREYLISESYLLLDGAEAFSVTGACEETCILDGINVNKILVESEDNASINIKKVNTNTTQVREETEEEKAARREALLVEKVGKLNQEIEKNNLRWVAGETPFSEFSHEEKRRMYKGKVPNFQGFEFYKGGIFETLAERARTNPRNPNTESSSESNESKNFLEILFARIVEFFTGEEASTEKTSEVGDVKSVTASAYVDAWDWRETHGADDPSSFYFDGNPDSLETGNGWITGVRNQSSCGSCWAFAATGATEALANLYYNQHYDLDLAEQDALSCSGAGSCSGGWPGVTLDYYTSTGVVNEGCFPYTATDQPCGNRCSNPSERINISGKVTFSNKTEDNLKGLIIQYGPISGGIYSWGHAMTLVGWYTDGYGSPIWIFKNSWGKGWGDGGYVNIKTAITNIGWTHALVSPVISSQTRTIRCIDADGDGFYNWGISSSPPESCPEGVPDNKDCDDSDPSLSRYDANFDCVEVMSDIYSSLSSYDFQGIPVGQTSQTQEIVIGNQGELELNISNIAIEDTTHFVLNLSPESSETPCGEVSTEMNAGQSCSIEVIFTPNAESAYNTPLVISSDDEKRPSLNVALSGYGTYNPQTVCSFFDGDWINSSNKCFNLSQKECTDYRGSVNLCDYLCYPSIGCTQNCIPCCVF